MAAEQPGFELLDKIRDADHGDHLIRRKKSVPEKIGPAVVRLPGRYPVFHPCPFACGLAASGVWSPGQPISTALRFADSAVA